MDPVLNPYSPGAGRKPAALVGRGRQLSEWEVALKRAEHGRSTQPMIFYGLRGVGKTVLLSELRRKATARTWIVAQVEAGGVKSLRELLGEALHAPLADISRPAAGKRLLKALKTALSFKASYDSNGTWNFGLDLANVPGGGADTGTFETDLKKLISDLAGAASEEGTGVALLIDEAQDLSDDELSAMCAIAHAAAQDDWPVIIAFAGLPSLPRMLAEAKSYAERFSHHRIEELGNSVASDAILIPSRDVGVQWEEDAADLIVKESGGYPYFLQQFGQDTWNVASGDSVSQIDVIHGVADGRRQLDNGFFRVRWDRATHAEQEYMRAMAQDEDAGSSSGAVAARLKRTSSSLGPARANLISKGLVYAPEHGIIAFTVPGMVAFIRRQVESD